MTSEQFSTWLAGFLAGAGKPLTAEQLEAVCAKALTVKSGAPFKPSLPVPLPPLAPLPFPYPFDTGWTCACGARVGMLQVHNCTHTRTISWSASGEVGP